MSAQEKKTGNKYKNWRIRPELHKEVELASVQEDVPMYALAEKAWRSYSAGNLTTPDPKLEAVSGHYGKESFAARNPLERKLVEALLRFLRDTSEPAHERWLSLLETTLRPWSSGATPKANAKR